MAFALILIGLVLVSVGIQNTQGQLGTLLLSDFTASGSSNSTSASNTTAPATSFWAYLAGIVVVGALGNITSLRTPSRLTLGLIMIVLLLSNSGFFQQLQQALANPQSNPNTAPALPLPTSGDSSSITGLAGNAAVSAGQSAASAVGSAVGSGLAGIGAGITPDSLISGLGN